MIETIKSYLVGLGFSVDRSSYQQAQESINKLSKSINDFASSATKGFSSTSIAAGGVMAGISAIVGSIYELTIGVAGADLQNQMFARQMWMNVDSAREYKTSLDSLGVSLQQLYLSPELLDKFTALRKQAQSMEMPSDFEDVQNGVRNITFEFARFKLETSYAMQWVSYYLDKDLIQPLFAAKGGLKGINDWITQNMPVWTKKVADGFAAVVQVGQTAGVVLKDIVARFKELTPATQAFLAVLVGYKMGLLNLLNPVTIMLGGIVAALLLIDDYMTWKRGGKSEYGEVWKELADNGDLDKLQTATGDLVKNFDDLINKIAELFGLNTRGNPLQFLVEALTETEKLISNIILLIERLMDEPIVKGTVQIVKGIVNNVTGVTPSPEGVAPDPGLDPNNPANSPDNKVGLLNKFGALIKNDFVNFMRYGFKPSVTIPMGMGSETTAPAWTLPHIFTQTSQVGAAASQVAYRTNQPTASPGMSYISSPTYHIYGNNNPQSIADVIQGNDSSTFGRAARTLGGVIV